MPLYHLAPRRRIFKWLLWRCTAAAVMLAAAMKQGRQQGRAVALQMWLITEFHWPTAADHAGASTTCKVGSPANCADPEAPAYLALRKNASFLQAHGAQLFDGVDGYQAARWLHQKVGLRWQ